MKPVNFHLEKLHSLWSDKIGANVIVRRHLQKQLILWSLIALLALTGIMTVIDFIHELSKVDQYSQLLTAIYLTVLSVPMLAYELLPLSVLIGGLAGLGNLSAQNELLAIESIGYSRKQMVLFVMNPPMLLFFAAVMLLMSELVVPSAEQRIIQFERQEESQQVKDNLWVRDKNNFIHIGRRTEDLMYQDITVYEYNRQQGRLDKISRAETMRVEDRQYLLENTTIAQFDGNEMALSSRDRQFLPRTVSRDDNLTGAALPESLNFMRLHKEIKLMEQSRLNADFHRLIFWRKISSVLSIIAMLMIAIPLVFANTRDNTLGKRLFAGTILGLIYIIADKFVSNLFVVGQLPIWMGAFLVPSLVIAIAYWRLRQQ